MNKIGKLLSSQAHQENKKEDKLLTLEIRWVITTNSIDIKRIIKEYYCDG